MTEGFEWEIDGKVFQCIQDYNHYIRDTYQLFFTSYEIADMMHRRNEHFLDGRTIGEILRRTVHRQKPHVVCERCGRPIYEGEKLLYYKRKDGTFGRYCSEHCIVIHNGEVTAKTTDASDFTFSRK